VHGEGDERPVCVARGLPQMGNGDGEKKEAERTVAGALKQKPEAVAAARVSGKNNLIGFKNY